MIACVQETHSGGICIAQLDNYAIYFGGSVTINRNITNAKTGGVAFVIHNSIIPNVIQINRVSGRIMPVRPRTGKTYLTSQF